MNGLPQYRVLDQVREQARRALAEHRLDDAASLAADVLAQSPHDVVAAQTLGHALLGQGRAAAAVKALRPVADHSQDPATETLLARALASAGQRGEALDRLRSITERRPVFVLGFLELGDQLVQAGDFEEAFEVFTAGLSLEPEATVLRVALGNLHLRRNDRAGAGAAFCAAHRAAPQRRDATMGVAKVLELSGAYDRAVEFYRRVLELRPGDPIAHVGLGRCLVELGERAAGEASLRAASRSDPQATALAAAQLAATSRGRLFLRPSAVVAFLRDEAA